MTMNKEFGLKRLSKIRTALLEAVFPSDLYCIRCGRIIDKSRYYGLCDKCSDGINWVGGSVCGKCGRLLGQQPGSLCADCSENERYFDKGYTCAFYGVYAREIVTAMKIKGRSWIGRKLGEAMADRMACEDEVIDLVIPVPVHPEKEKKRGYNQAAVIGRSFAENYREKTAGTGRGEAVFLDALKRTRSTAPMKGLDVWKRKANVEGAFALRSGMEALIKGKTVAVVDDIMTTGSTLSECAGVLKEARPARIIAVTFAAGGDMNVPENGA